LYEIVPLVAGERLKFHPIEFTAKAAVSWSIPMRTHPAFVASSWMPWRQTVRSRENNRQA
jgi:hypothetical protein